jgi:hypothetical protein
VDAQSLSLRAKVEELGERRSELWATIERDGPTLHLLLVLNELQDDITAAMLEEIEDLQCRLQKCEKNHSSRKRQGVEAARPTDTV